MIRIIDNKKIDLTNSEFELYQSICKSYDDEYRGLEGKDLFSGLFETDNKGFIIFLRPPTTFTSMEIYMFLVGVMVHQHLGTACDHVDKKIKILDNKIQEANVIIAKANELLAQKSD